MQASKDPMCITTFTNLVERYSAAPLQSDTIKHRDAAARCKRAGLLSIGQNLPEIIVIYMHTFPSFTLILPHTKNNAT